MSGKTILTTLIIIGLVCVGAIAGLGYFGQANLASPIQASPVSSVVPTSQLTLTMISDAAPEGYIRGNLVYINFNNDASKFVLSDKYGTFSGTYTYIERNGQPNQLVLDFASYPAWTVNFNDDGTSFTGQEAGYGDSGTYQWIAVIA